jgi:hypothetical protein
LRPWVSLSRATALRPEPPDSRRAAAPWRRHLRMGTWSEHTRWGCAEAASISAIFTHPCLRSRLLEVPPKPRRPEAKRNDRIPGLTSVHQNSLANTTSRTGLIPLFRFSSCCGLRVHFGAKIWSKPAATSYADCPAPLQPGVGSSWLHLDRVLDGSEAH